jgi:phosphohistidine swiveling domain-containing protein
METTYILTRYSGLTHHSALLIRLEVLMVGVARERGAAEDGEVLSIDFAKGNWQTRSAKG